MSGARALRGAIAVSLACLAALCLGCAALRTSQDKLLARARTATAPQDRRAALLELRGPLDASGREDLRDIMANDVDPATRALAARKLSELAGRSGEQALRQAAVGDVHWTVRCEALSGLARVVGPEVQPDLERALGQDPDPRVRVRALKLARAHLPRHVAVACLLEGLSDGAQAVRLQAALLLAELTGLSVPPERQAWEAALAAAERGQAAEGAMEPADAAGVAAGAVP